MSEFSIGLPQALAGVCLGGVILASGGRSLGAAEPQRVVPWDHRAARAANPAFGAPHDLTLTTNLVWHPPDSGSLVPPPSPSQGTTAAQLPGETQIHGVVVATNAVNWAAIQPPSVSRWPDSAGTRRQRGADSTKPLHGFPNSCPDPVVTTNILVHLP